jgi:hypothetical protein
MNDDRIERIWRRGRDGDDGLTRDQLARMLRASIAPGTRYFRMFLAMHLAVLLAVLVLEGINLVGYYGNRPWFIVHGAITALALGFASWGIHLTGELGKLDRADLPVADDVRRQLRFYEKDYARWLWMSAASIVMLALALGTWIDNDDGQFRINKPVVFFGVQAVMLFGSYALYRATHAPYIDELRRVLHDLENQILERSGSLQVRQARLRPWMIVLVVVLSAFAILGLVLALRYSG